MKKILYIGLLLLAIICSLVACRGNDNSSDDNGVTNTPPTSSDGKLTSQSLNINDDVLSGSVSNDTVSFAFVNDISVSDGAVWVLSTDIYGMHSIVTKTAPLSEGENTFYIHITNADQSVKTYTVNIYRKHLYTVNFNTNGGTNVETQYVEEGELVTLPTTDRIGYTFSSWDYDFTAPITDSITVSASWNANTDTPYKVEYYLENLDLDGFDLMNTEDLAGTTDTVASTSHKNFEHFTFNSLLSTSVATISGDGSTVIKLYYNRNIYAITLSQENLYLDRRLTQSNDLAGLTLPSSLYDALLLTGEALYPYGTEITLSAKAYNDAYYFIGWFVDDNLLSNSADYTFTITKNVDITAKSDVRDEINNLEIHFVGGANEEAFKEIEVYNITDKAITEIVIPSYITKIAEGAFSGCSNLESITLPFSNLTEMGVIFENGYRVYPLGYFFGTNYYEKSYEATQTVNSNVYIHMNPYPLTENYYIPSSLKTINILGGSISSSDFENLTSITSVNLGKDVSYVASYSFGSCRSLKSVTIADDNPYYTIVDNGLYSKDGSVCHQKSLIRTVWDYVDLMQLHISSESSIDISEDETKVVYFDYYANIFDFFDYLEFISNTIEYGRSYSIKINVNNNPYYHVADGCLIETQPQTLIYAEDGATIPTDGSVKHIGDLAFMGVSENIILPVTVESIYSSSFASSTAKVFYEGTKADWEKVTVTTGVNGAIEEQIVFYSESAPTTEGNFWHYVDGVPTAW